MPSMIGMLTAQNETVGISERLRRTSTLKVPHNCSGILLTETARGHQRTIGM